MSGGSSGQVEVRPATSADMKAVGRLGALLVSLHHNFDPERFMAVTPRTEEAYAAYLDSQLANPDVIVFVAETNGGGVMGYSYAALEGIDYMALRGPAGVLYDLVVDPAHRGGGVGRLLLETTAGELAKRGAPRLVLSTAERNEAAQRLFATAGFRRTMIEMTRELGAA